MQLLLEIATFVVAMSNRNCTIVTIEVKVELTTEVETANAMVIAFTTSFSVGNFPAGPGSWKMGGYGGRRRELQRGHRVRFQDVFGEPTLHRGDFPAEISAATSFAGRGARPRRRRTVRGDSNSKAGRRGDGADQRRREAPRLRTPPPRRVPSPARPGDNRRDDVVALGEGRCRSRRRVADLRAKEASEIQNAATARVWYNRRMQSN